MEEIRYVKVFAGLAIYYDLIPRSLVDLQNLKGSTYNSGQSNEVFDEKYLYSSELKDIKVSTLYLMQHIDDGCNANCAYCIQAKDSVNKHKKSLLVDKEVLRIPLKLLQDSLKNNSKIKNEIKRICIQTIFNKKTVENLLEMIQAIRAVSDIPISVCCIPISKDYLKKIKDAGADYITINYETATRELFSIIRGKDRKGPYRWEKVTEAIDNSLEIFGATHVTSHLQIGLGETQEQALAHVQNLFDKKVLVGLFSFCPVPGTSMADKERVSHAYFHQVQLASYLIKTKDVNISQMSFDSLGNIVNYGIDKQELTKIIHSGIPFKNTGCPGCNRVYYETNPGERFYSYPRDLREEEIHLITNEIFSESFC